MTPLTFVVPGPLDQISGGYLFDRHLVDGMRAAGRPVSVVEMPGRYPDADPVARAGAKACLDGLPDHAVVVIDGLALLAFDPCLQSHAQRLRIVGFVHHPLALETGLPASQAHAFATLEARLWPQLRGIICPSTATAHALAAAGVNAARIKIAPPGTKRPACESIGQAGETVRLLTVGAVSVRKGQLVLVEALATMGDAPWHLECIGSLTRDPHTAAALWHAIAAARLDHKISLAGELPGAALADAYTRADVFVLPSFHEGYGMACAEALAQGLPIVATTAGAIPETVPPDAAIFVAPGDAAGLRDALSRIIAEPALRARLAAAAKAAGASLPTWPQAIARWSAALDALVA